MNRKQFGILLVLVLVLGAWGVNRLRHQTSSWSGGGAGVGQKLLGEFAVNDVAQISIVQGPNQVTLIKTNDLWRVAQRGDYPANFSEISTLLLKLKDLKVIQTEQVGASQLPRLELAPSGTNSPTKVEFRDNSGKAIKTLTLGKKHMKSGGQSSPMDEPGGGGGWPDGRYVQAGGTSDQVALISDPLTDIEPDAAHWLNKDFFKIEKARSIAVTFPDATNSWKLVRETEGGELKFAEANPDETLDKNKASTAGNPFSSPTFNDVIVAATPEQTGLDQPKVLSVETFDGFDYTIKVGAKTNDNYFVTMSVTATLPKERTPGKDEKPEDKAKLDKEFPEQQKKLEEKLTAEKAFKPWTFLVTGWTVDPILKERSQLLEEKKVETKPDPTEPDEPPSVEK
jgi:Domain of unknown function (DUF4340)